MMAFTRKFRNTILLAKVEVTKGTSATPTGADNAMLPVGEVSMTPIEADRVPRSVIRGYFGAPDALIGSTWLSVQFSVEAQSSGTAGTAPAWGALLQGCGFLETVSTAARVEYTPASTALKGVSIFAYADGLEYKMIGSVGNMNGAMNVGGIPVFNFQFWAPYVAPTAQANPTPTLTGWKEPLLVNDANTVDLVVGGTYTTGTVSGGTSYVSGGVEFDFGNQMSRLELIGAKEAVIADRNITGTIKTLDLTAAQEITMLGHVTSGTAQAVSLTHGTAAGSKVIVHFGQAKLLNVTPVNLEGVWTLDVPFEAPPSSGNDDMRIVAL
jgi:hypothetical protein